MSNYYNYGDSEKEFEEIRKLILKHLNADYFNISFRYQLDKLPPEIGKMQALQELLINYCYRLQELPPNIGQLPKLRYLQISNSRSKELPENLDQLQQIGRLNLSYQSYTDKSNWEMLASLTQLQSLDLSASLNRCKQIPQALFQLRSLEFLYLSENNLKQLPNDFAQLQQLRVLDLGHNNFSTFPEVLLELPQLETLVINAQAINTLPKEILGMPALKELKVSGKDTRRYPNVSLMEKLFAQLQKRSLSLEYAHFLLKILQDPEELQQLDEAELVDILNSDIEVLVVQALPLLEEKLRKRKPSPLKAGDRIVIKGKLGGKKSTLKNRIKSLDIQTGVKLNAQTTHLVLGRFPKLSWSKLQAKVESLSILTEAMLVEDLNRLEMPYLLEAEGKNHSQLEHIRALLQSGQEDNILLAFEILHGGGFPQELVTDLFLLYKETNRPKIRREALHFINQYGPSEFGMAVKQRLSVFGTWVTEATVCKNLLYYCEAGNLNRKQVVDYLYKKHKKGASFALLHLDLEDKKAFFADDLKKERLNLSGLDLTQLPKDLAKMGTIRELNLSNNYFSNLPELVFTDLKDLEILKLQTMLYMGRFPERLLRIPSLKKVVLSTKYRNMPSKKSLQESGLVVEYLRPYRDEYY